MLNLNRISFSYGSKPILRNFSLSVQPGEIVYLSGPNGIGKSTVLGIASGAIPVHMGSVEKTCRVGFSPQDCTLFEDLSVIDNLRFFARCAGTVLPAEYPLPIEAYLKTKVKKLSGGMKKAVSICCAALGTPRLLILDEPTAALDDTVKALLLRYLQNYPDAEHAVLFTGHDKQEAISLGARIVPITEPE